MRLTLRSHSLLYYCWYTSFHCHCKYIVPCPYVATRSFVPVSPTSLFDIVSLFLCLLRSSFLIRLSWFCFLFLLFLAISPFSHSFQKGVWLIHICPKMRRNVEMDICPPSSYSLVGGAGRESGQLNLTWRLPVTS